MKFFKRSKKKTNWKYILIVVILAVLVGGVLFWQFGLKDKAVSPEEEGEEPTREETADWKTYRNKEYGYEIKYPQVLFSPGETPGGTIFLMGSQEKYDPSGFIIPKEFSIHIDVDDLCYYGEPIKAKNEFIEFSGEIELDGKIGSKYIFKGDDIVNFTSGKDSAVIFAICISTDEHDYQITFSGHLRDRENIEKLFNRMVSTFRFIEEVVITTDKIEYGEGEKIWEEEVIEEITKPLTVAGLLNDSKLKEAEEVKVVGKYAYVTGENGLIVIDISNPKNPVIVSSTDEKLKYSRGLFILDNYLYIAGGASLRVVDISDPTSPIIIGSFHDLFREMKITEEGKGKSFTFAEKLRDIHILDRYGYIIDSEQKRLFIVDISDPKNPFLMSSILITKEQYGTTPRKIYLSDNYCYVLSWNGWGNNALTIVDISDPKNPKKINSFSDEKLEDAMGIYVLGKYAYIATGESILAIVDVSNPAAPLIVNSIEDKRFRFARSVYVSGKYAYVIGGEALTIVDISDPKTPEIAASISEPKFERAEDFSVSGRYVYVIAPDIEAFVIIDLKGEITFTGKSIPVLSKEILKLEEKFIEKNEREIAFLQSGDIWVISKDLKKKHKLIDTEEKITNFSFSPDGKEIYWRNNQGEIWKLNEKGEIKSLVTVEEDMKEEIQEGWLDFESFSYLKGKVTSFHLSPDGEYIAYETLEGYTGCCAGPPSIPVSWIWIMKNDGTGKVEIEMLAGRWGSLIFFDGWIPGSKRILFHFSYPDAATQHSIFFEVGINGKNPKVYTEIFKIFKHDVEVKIEDISIEDLEMVMMGIGDEPVYSPSGKKVAYIRGWGQIRLRDTETKETKTILEDDFSFSPAYRTLKWSKDGALLSVKTNDKIYIFSKEGKIVLEIDFEAEEIEDVVFSSDNKYVAGVFRMRGERIKLIFFINLITQEKKEFKLPEFENYEGTIYIRPQCFSKSNKLYYLIDTESEKAETKQLFPQLWVIDTDSWKNYKALDDVLRVVRVP